MHEKVILTAPMRTMVPIIKIVGDFCNLRCSYCFYNVFDQQTPRVMSVELLRKFIQEYLNLFDGRVTFIWHGGEPLLAGMDFFRTIVAVQDEYGDRATITNIVQTNATLVRSSRSLISMLV